MSYVFLAPSAPNYSMSENSMGQSAYRPLQFLASESIHSIWFDREQFTSQGNIMNNENRVAGAREDNVTGAIESRTSQIPSAAYLGAALGSMAAAAILRMAGKKHASLFVGQWAAPFLLMGVYNKMGKQHGSDGESRQTAAAA
jgi:hypothetical protein